MESYHIIITYLVSVRSTLHWWDSSICCRRHYFILLPYYTYIVRTYHNSFIHSTVEHLACSQFGLLKILVHVLWYPYLYVCISFVCLGVALLCPRIYVRSILAQTVNQFAEVIATPPPAVWEFYLLHTSLELDILSLFSFSDFVRYVVGPFCGFNLYFPDNW